MQTTINTIKFAKLLRVRRAELAKKQSAAVKKYQADFKKWKVALGDWLVANGRHKANEISREALKREGRYREDTSPPGLSLRGYPKPPVFPKCEQIAAIDGTIRHLAITAKENVCLSTEEVTRLLGGEYEEAE